jgi:hypothetical protein
MLIVAVLAILALAFAGRQYLRKYTFIDRSFLAGMREHPTARQWNDYCDELLFLVAKGDEEALDAAIRVLPAAWDSDDDDNRRDWMAQEIWENLEEGHELETFEILPLKDQVKYLLAYDDLAPDNWDEIRDTYLAKHPDLKKLYAAAADTQDKADQTAAPVRRLPAAGPIVALEPGGLPRLKR